MESEKREPHSAPSSSPPQHLALPSPLLEQGHIAIRFEAVEELNAREGEDKHKESLCAKGSAAVSLSRLHHCRSCTFASPSLCLHRTRHTAAVAMSYLSRGRRDA
ncbi:uncharacterized protein DS421_10g301630 [Arachis hypogaea]|nr:uncharacterized protein DS421_10g301600 [Arachis hypogaea]QHO16201.1 uncharacterized protein DS421_10g301610 [Arachis hypogaea]QHO16202.1 uncharacterized protein DS421_10g301620 [Arachis hypogaea]QHO16203.1 uncharacterized protein DS421_10g301630 [Arachis hypogaea]